MEKVNDFLLEYLEILDSWQRRVDNIRLMHHDVWKGSRLSPLIRQHRAGSRVEKQTRILPKGGQTDVDYMFEVIGIDVQSIKAQLDLYFKSHDVNDKNFNEMSRTFGHVLANAGCKDKLESDERYGDVFKETFLFDENRDAYMLNPNAFKARMVALSGLDYERLDKTSDNCPSIAGYGAMNEYDGVPCLRLANWPDVTDTWKHRFDSFPFDLNWRNETVLNVPLFLVPTGNPLSRHRSSEFRLSFSMVEIACFKHLTKEMRTLYGITKFVFKALYSQIELLSSYHVKTLMLWKVERKPRNYWYSIKPIDFITEMLFDMNECVKRHELLHFFIDKCNIYPLHKHTTDKVSEYARIISDVHKNIYTTVRSLAKDDLGVSVSRPKSMSNNPCSISSEEKDREKNTVACSNPEMFDAVDFKADVFVGKTKVPDTDWIEIAKQNLSKVHSRGPDAYIAGYLTRLLSVITFSMLENFDKSEEQGKESVEEMRRLFLKYRGDSHIARLIPFVNTCIERVLGDISRIIAVPGGSVVSDCDMRSLEAHKLLEKVISGETGTAMNIEHLKIPDANTEIGISVTKLHQQLLPDDQPIHFMIKILETENAGRCPRFYIDPELFLCHLNIQKDLSDLKCHPVELKARLDHITGTVNNLSIYEPYLGKLSYRFAGTCLLKAYRLVIFNMGIDIHVEVPNENFDQRKMATNFDLR